MKLLLLALLIAYILAMFWLQRHPKRPDPSFRPWHVRLKPRQKK